jgi:hypothetical protein
LDSLSFFERDKTTFEMTLSRVVLWGTLGSAFVQLFSLGHGDLGLLENLKQAALFVAFGGLHHSFGSYRRGGGRSGARTCDGNLML